MKFSSILNKVILTRFVGKYPNLVARDYTISNKIIEREPTDEELLKIKQLEDIPF